MSNVVNEQGSLSINSENIFPIIKKWLYSDHDIFFRELIYKGCNAIKKMKKLEIMGEVNLPEDNEWKVTVKISPEEKTIRIIDNGIGMTADEVKQYINQIAFPVPRPLWSSIRIRPTRTALSVTSASDFIPHLW